MMKKITAILTLMLMTLGLTACGNYQLIAEDVTVEYGTPISVVAKDYVDTENFDKDELKILKEEAKVTIDAENEKDKDYPAVGDYVLTISHGDKNLTVNIHVVDTVKPEFNECTTIQIFAGEKLEYASYITATDLTEVTTTFDDSKVALDKAGEYKVTATAIDTSKNTSTKEITVTVSEKTEEEKAGTVEVIVDKKTKNVTSKIIPPKKVAPAPVANNNYSNNNGVNTVDGKPLTTTTTKDGGDGGGRTYYSTTSNQDLTGAFMQGSGGAGQDTVQYYPTGELYSRTVHTDNTGQHGTCTVYNKNGSVKSTITI